MRRFLAALAVLVVPVFALAGPILLTNGTTLRIVAPTNGTSTATSLSEGNTGCYLVSVENERSCVCQNQTTCAETAAKDALCIPAGGVRYLRSIGPFSVSVISAGGTGVVWFNPTDCH